MKPECDIILLSYESPKLLRDCVESVLEHTRVRSRLIIVDNDSKDPRVRAYLQNVRGAGEVTVEKVFSEENAGFAAGMNKGMRLSEAPFVCLLNNDCVVTEGWLEEMISVARSHGGIGLVNPQSNTFGSRPDGKATLAEHAGLLRHDKGKYTELGHAIGFACLIKREVLDRIGHLDEAYEGVCYEDTDLSVRAQKAGYICALAEGAYVHHVERASRKNLKKADDIYRKNRELFESKWGRILRVFFLDRASGADGHMAEDYEALKGLARERAFVEFWIKAGRLAAEISKGFDRRNMVRHSDIKLKVDKGGFTGPAALWRVLTKKKKYDAIILDRAPLSAILRRLKFLHGAKVFSLEEGLMARGEDGRIFDLREPAAFAGYLREKIKA